jgi:hypothetical protein
MTKRNNILPEDLNTIQQAKLNVAYMQALTGRAVAEQKQAELQVKNILLMAYLKYGLSNNDKIDDEGNIIWAEDNSKEETTK